MNSRFLGVLNIYFLFPSVVLCNQKGFLLTWNVVAVAVFIFIYSFNIYVYTIYKERKQVRELHFRHTTKWSTVKENGQETLAAPTRNPIFSYPTYTYTNILSLSLTLKKPTGNPSTSNPARYLTPNI